MAEGGGGTNKQKKYPTPLWIFQKSAYESSWRVGEVSFFSFFNHSPLSSTLSDNRKKNLYSYSLFHPDSIYSSDNNISYSEKVFQVYFSFLFFFDLQKTAIQHNTKKGKETKRKNWSQNLQKTYYYCS